MWKYKNQINDYMTGVADDNEGEIWVYGDIVDEAFWDDEVSPVQIRNMLDEMGNVGTINMRINSYGGSVYAGNAIINILDSYRRKTGAKIVAYIEGIAASMGSGIPMVADKIYMAKNAMYMLHKPYTIIAGNSNDLEKEVEVLEKAEETLVANYMRHFNGTEDELRQMLADETWLTAEEALSYGFCDEIIPAVALVAASAKGVTINGKNFMKDADKILAKFNVGVPLALVKNEKEETKKVFDYDNKLKDYGIDETTFETFDMSAENVLNILDSAVVKSAVVESAGTEIKPEFISESDIQNAFGKQLCASEVIDFARIGMDAEVYTIDKAKAYDKLVNAAVDEAIANGVRAKGENFNDTKWRKAFAAWSYDEILDQSKEWADEAKSELKAGIRVSEPNAKMNDKDDNLINPEDYKI